MRRYRRCSVFGACIGILVFSLLSVSYSATFPANQLPPHITKLVDIGERCEWAHDTTLLMYVTGSGGEVMEVNIPTRQSTLVSGGLTGYYRAYYLPNGDYLLTRGPDRGSTQLYWLDKNRIGPELDLGILVKEGIAVSRTQLKIAYTSDFGSIYTADIVYTNGTPALTNKTVVVSGSGLEPQNFRPPNEQELIYSCYDCGSNEVYGVDLNSLALVNYSNTESFKEEPEGILPSGDYTFMESDKHNPCHDQCIDIYRLTLDGTGTDFMRVTFFNDVQDAGGNRYKASNPSVRDDGLRFCFQEAIYGAAPGVGQGIYIFDMEAAGIADPPITTAPSPPSPLAPSNGAVDVATPAILTWSSVPGASTYRCQVSTSSAFGATDLDQTGITQTSTAASGLGEGTNFYWRVNASNGYGTSAWSSVYSFTTAQSSGSTVTLVEATFDTNEDGFVYVDDPFRGTNQPLYASGTWGSAFGVTGGGLMVNVGGIDDIVVAGMSGGFQTTFSLSSSSDVTLTFFYKLDVPAVYESDEYGEVLVAVDGALVGGGGNDYVTRIAEGGVAGWTAQTVSLGTLSSGSHTITLGGYNNQKTYPDEMTTVLIDNVKIEADPGVSAFRGVATFVGHARVSGALSVVDLSGRVVKRASLHGVSADRHTSSLPSGVYFIVGSAQGPRPGVLLIGDR